MYVGINSFFEHPSIAIVEESRLLFAAEDERFTRQKGGRSYSPYHAYFPFSALFRGLKYLGRSAEEIKAFGFSYSPWRHLISLGGCFTGARLSTFREEMSAFFSALNVRTLLGTEYGYRPDFYKVFSPRVLTRVPFSYFEHHAAHSASAFYLSGFEESLIVSADGAGEKTTTRVSIGKGKSIQTVVDHHLPNSLGHLYSAVTKHLGFRPFSDEYKVMGLAAYGVDEFHREFERLVELQPNGRFGVNLELLLNLGSLLGRQRLSGEDIEVRHQNIARSLQVSLERAVFHVVRDARARTGISNLCCAGGVFMNSVVNGQLRESGLFKDIFFMPASSDAGTAVGAAALLHASNSASSPQLQYPGMFLGTSYSNVEIASILRSFDGLTWSEESEESLCQQVAEMLSCGQIGATFRGRMEFGDRALGNRSILADPQVPAVLDLLNFVKGREAFRPVAPIVLQSAVGEFFLGSGDPYMMTTALVRPEKRSVIGGCVHVDGSARVQAVSEERDPFLARLLKEFAAVKGYPVLINTSFNLHGEPMIESPRQALVALKASKLSFLVMNNFLVKKVVP